MTQHTPEQWYIVRGKLPIQPHGQTLPGPEQQLMIQAGEHSLRHADVCIAACAGMADPVKEIRELRHDLADLRDRYTEGSLRGQVESLRRQLAEMTVERDVGLRTIEHLKGLVK